MLCFDILNKNELFSKHNIGIPLHICDLKEMIIKDHPQLERIWNNTISRGLKLNLKYSYQLYFRLPKKMFTKEIFERWLNLLFLLKRLEASDSEWIYSWFLISA